MPRVIRIGQHAETKPEGMLREIIWPQMAKLDEGTNEGMVNRILSSEGGDSRTLPRTFYFQFEQAPGHFSSFAVGNVDEITIDGASGLVSGRGWVMDSEQGALAALAIQTKTLYHNSIDIAEAKVEIEEHGDWWDDDFTVDLRFVEWKFAATTGVGKPAFADANEEILASIYADDSPLVMPPSDPFNLVVADTVEDITAAATGLPSWDYFHVPEPAEHRPITVGAPDENGWIPISGHLALWNSCHGGIEGRCVIPPRPQDNYASFNQPGVLTDRGMVNVGPITLYGGHISWKQALDDPASVWADVHVTPGIHGPWISGVVRPDVSEDNAKVYAARASRISGHWKSGELKVIISTNVPAFNVPTPSFSFTLNENDEVDELAASYPECSKPEPSASLPDSVFRFTPMDTKTTAEVRRWIEETRRSGVNANGNGFIYVPNATQTTITVTSPDAAEVLAEKVVEEIEGEVDETDDAPSDEDLALALELDAPGV